jgi:hypothetical protein
MPIEGIPTDSQGDTTPTTPDAAVNNTDANQAGAETQAATTEGAEERKFTQADIDRIVKERLKSGVKSGVQAELKKLLGEDGPASVEDLQRQLSEERQKVHLSNAREAVREFLGDPDNKLNVKSENIRAIEKLVMQDIELDASGQPTNIKAAIKAAQSLAPSLFENKPPSINAGNGRTNAPLGGDMNAFIRSAAGVN